VACADRSKPQIDEVIGTAPHECLAIRVARKLKVIFAAWPAALRQPAPPATLAQRPAFHLDHSAYPKVFRQKNCLVAAQADVML
jgi:hypothetical protein